MNSPMALRLLFLENMSGMPIAIIGIVKALISTLNPSSEMIHAVAVVPILAPIMTPIACVRLRSPAFTKLTTITVVADEDWIIAVMKSPVSAPRKRLDVIAESSERRRSPAAFWSPSLIIFIP